MGKIERFLNPLKLRNYVNEIWDRDKILFRFYTLGLSSIRFIVFALRAFPLFPFTPGTTLTHYCTFVPVTKDTDKQPGHIGDSRGMVDRPHNPTKN